MAILVTVNEGSTAVFTVTFTDENGEAVEPNEIAWSLVTREGGIVNGREDVAVATPAAVVDIVLSGDDLALVAGSNNERALVVKATYDSGAGSDLPIREMTLFAIRDLLDVP